MNRTKRICGLILTLLIFPALVTNAYAHTSVYESGYKAPKKDAVYDLSNPVGNCNALGGFGDNTTQLQIDPCAQGYNDPYSALDHTLVYESGYKAGKQDAVSSLSHPVGGCSGFADIGTQQEIDTCHQGYNDTYNHFCGIHGRAHSEYPCDDHTHTLAYIIGYNGAVQDQVDDLNNPPGDCSTWTLGDNATYQQIDKCLQGYEDSYNYFCAKHAHTPSEYTCRIKYSVPSFLQSTLLTIAYGIGYEHGKGGGDTSGDCDYDFMGITQHNNKWIDANKELQIRTITSVFMALHMKSLNAVRSKDMNQAKQIFFYRQMHMHTP